MRFSVSPTRVQVLTRDGFYVTVEGNGMGWLHCQGTRRWVFGAFRENFLLSNPAITPGRVVVKGVGLGGTFQVTVSVEGRYVVRGPVVFFRKPWALPKTPQLRVKSPSIRALGTRLSARWNAFAETQAQRREET